MPPSAPFAVLIAWVVMTMLVAAAATIEIPDRVRARGVLLPPEGLLKVRAPRSGRVEHLPVANGDGVSPGQVILRLSGAQRAPGRQPEVAMRLASLQRELRVIDDAVRRQSELAAAREDLNQRRLRLTVQRIEGAEAEARAHDERGVIAARRVDRVGQLAAAKAVSADAVAEAEAAMLSSRAAQQAAAQRILALEDERLRIEQQIVTDRDVLAALRRDSGLRREGLRRQIAAVELQSTLEVAAPVGGTVAGITVREGEFVAAGEVVMTVHAPGSRLEARLFLSPDNAGMISVGQRVELRLNAYPHQFFGTRSAVVTAISTVALPAHEADADLPVQGPVFVIRARLRQAAIQAGKRRWPLAPGTSFEADLVRARWPLYRWLLRSVSGDPVRA
jgi:membrane fusion protein